MQNSLTEHCPLCDERGEIFYLDLFYRCQGCQGIFKARRFLPGPEEEMERYLQHNNDVTDIAYQRFVSPITNSVENDFATNSLGLDFGAGTGPVISKVLGDKGYELRQFDSFFINDAEALQQQYDYIVCCEVIEHFHFPSKEFDLLKRLLKPKGRLYCMTHIYVKEIDFASWYYKNDSTHVFIYQRETLMKIRDSFQFASLTIVERLATFQK